MGQRDYTAAELVANNSHELTAYQLIGAWEENAALLDAHRQEMSATLARIDRAGRIGLAVLRAARMGRKTLKVADLLAAGEVDK